MKASINQWPARMQGDLVPDHVTVFKNCHIGF